MRDLSNVVFRGEPDGELRNKGGFLRPFFLTEKYDQAALYSGKGHEPIACVIQGKRLLDLTNPNPTDPEHAALARKLTDEFDDWTCRYSGEPRDVWSYIESGDLYDYEGTGSGERWNALFRIALDDIGYDAVRILDCTDGTRNQAVPVWVTYHRENIRAATTGEQLAARVAQQPWEQVQKWLARKDDGLLTRINRLSVMDDEFRLDRMHDIVPAENMRKVGYIGGVVTLWRGLPVGSCIRPGDWVALSSAYAREHADRTAGTPALASLVNVLPEDVYWAGTDEREFFYLPGAWRKDCSSAEEYLKELTPEQIRILCDGEMNRINRHEAAIEGVKEHVIGSFDHQSCGEYHGPAHWRRVCHHVHAVARAAGVDPLIGHLFSWVHDSQREDDGDDPGHGPRASDFILARKGDLFSFMRDDDLISLASACELHSNGLTQGSRETQSCWDADRLDLGRVGVTPRPEYLCTAYAKRRDVIQRALEISGENEEEISGEDLEGASSKDELDWRPRAVR